MSRQPHRLESLLELLEHKAEAFCRLSSLIGQMLVTIRLGAQPNLENVGNIFGELQREAERLKLTSVDKQLSRMHSDLTAWGVELTAARIQPMVEELYNRLRDALEERLFLAVSSERADFYRQPEPPFGKSVQDQFPSVIDEIAEAAKCYALSRPTASAFHSIRCLEIGIRALSRCLQIPDPTRAKDRNWGAMTKALKEAIDAKWPGSSTRLTGDGEFFDNAHAALAAMQNPWRNATMHLDQKYTEEEARHVFEVIKGFMRVLASRMDEDGKPLA